MPKTYEPEIIAGGGSSPFDDLMYRWIAARNAGFSDPAADHPDAMEDRCLSQYDTAALDEARSVADSLLNVPLYAGDARLVAFRDALLYTVQERAAQEVLVKRLSKHAMDIAEEHVENAVSWVVPETTDAVDLQRMLYEFENGSFDSDRWRRPNLSGEFDSDWTPNRLMDECLVADGATATDHEDFDGEIVSAVADAYEEEIGLIWEEACVKEIARSLGTGMERIANLARCASGYVGSDNARAQEALDMIVTLAEEQS